MSFESLFFIIVIFFFLLLLLLIFSYGLLLSRRRLSRRISSISMSAHNKVIRATTKQTEKQRRKLREESLRVVDQTKEKNRAATNPTLGIRLYQAGMTISVRNYRIICVFVGVFALLFGYLIFPFPIFFLPFFAIGVGMGLPYYIVNFRRKRRYKKFTMAFPNAVDVIVRGVRSGLPLNDCLMIISNDAEEPLRSEFKKMIDGMQLGLTMPEVCERLYRSIATPEVNFFSIVISIQSQAGGNLSEALSNLSGVLRERQRVADKIRALSMEAKASAYIIGSLPFIVSGLLTMVQPTHLFPLFTTTTGNIILYVCAGLMTFGILVMRKMINFKY